MHKYKSIQSIMQQVEGSICQTNTSAAPELAEFYRYWERRFFNAITLMIITSMATLHALLNVNVTGRPAITATGDHDAPPPARRTPLCQVKVTYNAPEIVITPALPTIYKFLGKVRFDSDVGFCAEVVDRDWVGGHVALATGKSVVLAL